jgi:anaerobic ribonucleoside-triphosphate reductase activating protein
MHAYVARICTSFIDVPDKIAVAIYFSGCTLRCKDCQNQELWDKKSGTKRTIDYVLNKIDNHTISDSVVFLGGEPTDQVKFLQELCSKITKKQKVLYTGREFEDLPTTLTNHLDMVICGPYRADLHVGGWPASSNQRILIKKDKRWTRLNTQVD